MLFRARLLTVTVSIIMLVLPSSTGADDKYKTCNSTLISCGKNFPNVGYPFWGDRRPKYCGHPALQLQCLPSEKGYYPSLIIGSKSEAPYEVLSMTPSGSSIILVLQGSQNIPCTSYNKNISYVFEFRPSVENITFVYNCPNNILPRDSNKLVLCFKDRNYNNHQAYYVSNMSAHKEYASCDSTVVPVLSKQLDLFKHGNVGSMTEVLSKGFEVNYEYSSECLKCKNSSGICGSSDVSDFVCLYKNGASKNVPHTGNRTLVLGIGIGGGILILVALNIGVCCYLKHRFRSPALLSRDPTISELETGSFFNGIPVFCLRKRRSIRKFAVFWKSEAAKCANVDAFLHIYGSFALTSYTYANIKKMTNRFNDKVGEGGYATVYKGKLPTSGRLVAVKVLKQSKGDGEDFLNEVASISRTNHVNVVSLLGFCYEGNKRALIYEFLSNGSLEKFTFHGNNDRIQSLPWETLFNIALGIARGLDYLHRGCNARILHLDIKPHNILLDEEFRPKISDFGLAKLCPLQDSTISMLEARGTIGYIAPEVFCRTIGGVSHKSDVYSFGMMVLDMVCGRKNLSADLQRSSEVYFPQWIYNHLELEVETSFQGTVNAEEKAVQRKMILVSLWCIQTYPKNRPSMNRVVEMLQGCVESIQMPPKPNQASPPRAALDNPVTLTETIELPR